MASRPSDSPFPASGSFVGPWIVGKLIGSGSYGKVFHAVHKDRPEAGSYALKVACRAVDERFEREAHLLSRIHHPSVPRFEDSGTWTSPEGEDYPYLVMEWVEGLSLYSWALEYGLTLRRVIGQLAQVARALQATHRHGVHRDVKGGNVRVSPEGKAVLLDFGSCWYPEASPLTGPAVPPVTDKYRSPQQLMYGFALEIGWRLPYDNAPTDDLYALGVTAYRLLAGAYPPRLPDNEDGSQKPVRLKAPRGLEQVCPELGELIERLLAEDPFERGSAQQVAEELEALLEYSRPALDEPWVSDASRQPTAKAKPPAPPKPAPPPVPPKPAPPPVPHEPAPPQVRNEESAGTDLGLLYGLAGGFVLGMLCMLLTRNIASRPVVFTEPESDSQTPEQPDAGTSLGDEGMASVSPSQTAPGAKGRIIRKIPDTPRPGQKVPPCNHRSATAIKGGCWLPVGADQSPCEPGDYEYEGRCYIPMPDDTARVPTSDEPQ
jgi:serine/threonine protein kinase